MTPYLPQILAAIAGVIIYFVLHDDIKEYLKINLKTNIIFPIFVIVTLFAGLMLAQTIHLSEATSQNTNSERIVSLNWCYFEDASTCQNNVNTLNNANYSKAISSGQYPMQLYIAVSLPNLIYKNAFSYFCAGILISWFIIFVGAKINERKS